MRSWCNPCVLVALVGCSATALRPRECDDASECRAAFGLGSVCGDAGYCEPPQQHPRCSEAYPPELLTAPEDFAEHIVVGSMFGFVDHRDTMLAAELAIRQLEREDGLGGVPFAMLHCDTTAKAGDDLTDLEASADVAQFLARVVGAPAIVGPRGSARTEAAFEAIRDDDVVLVSPSATSAALIGFDTPDPTFEAPGLLWRTVPPDTLQAEVIAADMRGRAVLRVAVIHQAGAYGDGLTALFEERFLAQGGIAVQKNPFSDGQFGTIVATVAESLVAGDAQEVLFLSSDLADYVAFLGAAVATDQLRAAYTDPDVGVFLADAAYNATLIADTFDGSAELYPRIRGTRPAPAEGVLFNAFAAAYAAEFQADAVSSGFTPHSYDAAWLVAYGIAWAQLVEGRIDGTGIARGLRRISGGERVEIQPMSWTVVVDRFSADMPIDVEGASGPLDYDPDTEETVAPIQLWAIEPDSGAEHGWGFVELDRIDP
jgi:branched-chain amino acid transport system substrate-binding protein